MSVWLKEHVVHDLLYPKGLPFKRFTEILLERGVPYEVVMRTIDRHTKSGFITALSGRFVLCDIDADIRREAETIMKMLHEKDLIIKSYAKGTRDCIERGLRKIRNERYLKEAK